MRRDRADARRVQRQRRLHPRQQVDEEQAGEVERQHGERVRLPGHLFAGIDAQHAVNEPLERTEQARRDAGFALVDARHVAAERLHDRDEQAAEERELEDGARGHENLSGFSIASTR